MRELHSEFFCRECDGYFWVENADYYDWPETCPYCGEKGKLYLNAEHEVQMVKTIDVKIEDTKYKQNGIRLYTENGYIYEDSETGELSLMPMDLFKNREEYKWK